MRTKIISWELFLGYKFQDLKLIFKGDSLWIFIWGVDIKKKKDNSKETPSIMREGMKLLDTTDINSKPDMHSFYIDDTQWRNELSECSHEVIRISSRFSLKLRRIIPLDALLINKMQKGSCEIKEYFVYNESSKDYI